MDRQTDRALVEKGESFTMKVRLFAINSPLAKTQLLKHFMDKILVTLYFRVFVPVPRKACFRPGANLICKTF